MNVLIQRNGQRFGPYSAAALQLYLEQGKLLPLDLARLDTEPDTEWRTLSRLMRRHGIASGVITDAFRPRRVLGDLRALDLNLLLPWRQVRSGKLLRDRSVLLFGGVGMMPILLICLTPGVLVVYWCIALYFAAIWAIFLFEMFRTSETRPQTAAACFFVTAFGSMPILLIVQYAIPFSVHPAPGAGDNLVARFLGMFLGVGIMEEACKAAVVFYIANRPGRVFLPQSVVLYGMISGLAFGSFEGVGYQLVVNRRADTVDEGYFLNVLRLTSLPFLHCVWSGISAYFIAFAAIVPRKRVGLWLVAILLPSLFHGVYNTFGPGLLGLSAAALSVLFLMSYLRSCKELKAHLTAP